MKVLLRLLVAFVVAVVLDGITKLWAEQSLSPYEPVTVFGEMFRFTLGYNTGVAFGLFANGGFWPLLVAGIVIVGLMIWFATIIRTRHLPVQAGWAIGLLLGGAIANFADRLLDGRVTDFLDVGIGTARWPTFNLADSFILLGLGLLMFTELTTKPEPVEIALKRD
jgi:signal peptidase II